MKKVLLDTNFILTCVAQKIDFFEEFFLMGIKIIIPEQVVYEIEGIVNSKKKMKFRDSAVLALELLDKNSFENVDLHRKNVDDGIVKYSKLHPDVLIATLDREIKKNSVGKNVVIRGKKTLEVI